MPCDESCRTAVFGKTERTVGWEGNGDPAMIGLMRHCIRGNPQKTDRPCLPPLTHSLTLDLEAHGGCAENVRNLCIDMSTSYIAGVGEHLPWAEITFDKFHVIKLVNEAVDEVRRQEVKQVPALKRSRYLWLKDKQARTRKQIMQFYDLSRMNLKTHRAYRIKESLREIFATATNAAEAEILLDKWHSWARRCRLEPMKKVATTIKKHRQGILNAFDSKLTNGRVEAINSLIQAAKARARGYRTAERLITVAYLIAGKLTHLPASPYNTRCWGQASA
jgi:transposase